METLQGGLRGPGADVCWWSAGEVEEEEKGKEEEEGEEQGEVGEMEKNQLEEDVQICVGLRGSGEWMKDHRII